MSERILGRSLVGAQFVCLAVALWPFAPWHASALGIVLVGAGVALAAWTLTFNRPGNFNIQPEVKRNARLIVSGPYAYVRHPMYSALILLVCGVVALHLDWINAAATIALVAVLAVKTVVEETRLEDAFDDYQSYASGVGRFVPSLYRRHPT